MNLPKWSKLSIRDRRALLLLALVAVAMVLLFAVLLPFWDAQQEIRSELESKEKFLGRYIQAIQAREQYRYQLAELEERLTQYRSMLLDARETNIATIQLEEVVRGLAAQSNIQVTRSNPLQERTIGEQYVKITLQITLQSDIGQLTNFLYALSTHDKFLVVEDFFLNSFRSKTLVRIQPRMNISGFIRLSQERGI